MVEGCPHGNGTLSFPNGEKYTGEFKYREKSGKGCYQFS